MLVPGNAVAREIERLRSTNRDIDEQIAVLRERQLENAEMCGNLSGSAEWVEAPELEPDPVPDPVPVPDPEPEPDPEEIPVPDIDGEV